MRTFGGFTGHQSAEAAWLALCLAACSSTQFTAGSDGGHDGGAGGNVSAAGQSAADSGGNAGEAGAPNPSTGGSDNTGGGDTADAGAGEDIGGGGTGGAQGGAAGNGTGGAQGGAAGNAAGGALAGSGGGPVVVPKVRANDDFVADAQGWTVTGDVSTAMPAVYSGGGGNPNGSISWVDGGGGTWYFMAPKKYLGDASAYYGGVLKFDLKVTEATMPFNGSDVELTSDAVTLAYDCTPDPTYTKYTSYTVPLKETGWKVGTLSGAAATAAQFKQVLSKLTRLRIRGEFNTGADTGHLDNVYFGLN